MQNHAWWALPTASLCALLGACAAESSLDSDYGGPYDDVGVGVGVGGGTSGSVASSSSSGGEQPLPPEQELESSFGAPVATGKYVWIANAASGRVAYIDGETLEIQIVEAGHEPTYLAPVPDAEGDTAIVLNVLSSDATLLRAHDGGLTTDSFDVPTNGNRWAISHDGRWATAWTDASEIPNPDPLDGYQDITLLDLKLGKSIQLSVGYRPVTVSYDELNLSMFAVTEDGVSVVVLGEEPAALDNILLSDSPHSRDVTITPDGAMAFIHRYDVATLGIVSLFDGELVDVILPAVVTDLDLSPDGEMAVAVMRDTGQVALMATATIFDDPSAFTVIDVPDATIGSVALAKESSNAFFYTNAIASSALTVIDSGDVFPTPKLHALHAPIKSVFPTPDGNDALVLHSKLLQSDYPSAISLVPVAQPLPSKIQGLDANPISIALTDDSEHALLALGAFDNEPYQMVVAHMTSMQIMTHALASKPISAGIVEGAGSGFVAQEHPEGRITFINFDKGEVRTLTGFELATEVVNGGTP